MTSRELFSVVLRRWYFMLLGAMISMAACYVTMHRPGVYWTHFYVVILAPTHEYYVNNLEDPHDRLAPMAGLVATDWNGAHHPLLVGSGDTTLYGEGQRRGVQVRMPNQGSQWRPLYFTPNIDVQIVDSDPEAVAREVRRVSSELDGLLQKRQDALQVQPRQRMSTMISPASPTVEYVAGSRSRAALATGLAGAAMTTITVYWIDRGLTSRSARRRARKGENAFNGPT
jgi:hypothetical protein